MKLLKSERAFKQWFNKVFFGQDTEDLAAPKHYPCLAYTQVKDWGYEEEEPVYLYKSDLEKMLKEIEEAE